LASLGVLPVEIGLLGTEEMEIVFLGMLVPFPDASSEIADPVIGSFALALYITGRTPDVPVALGVIFRGAGFLEPLVLLSVSSAGA